MCGYLDHKVSRYIIHSSSRERVRIQQVFCIYYTRLMKVLTLPCLLCCCCQLDNSTLSMMSRMGCDGFLKKKFRVCVIFFYRPMLCCHGGTQKSPPQNEKHGCAVDGPRKHAWCCHLYLFDFVPPSCGQQQRCQMKGNTDMASLNMHPLQRILSTLLYLCILYVIKQ